METGRVYRVQAVGARPGSDAATANNKHPVMRRNPAYAETRTLVHYCDSFSTNGETSGQGLTIGCAYTYTRTHSHIHTFVP